jgi:DNA repair exonuclease SbcCD ATPase subunit
MELAGSSEDMKRGLQLLGSQAQDARNAIGPLTVSLKSFKTSILDANSSLYEAFKAGAQVLQQTQEAVGGLQVRIESLQEQIEQLGFLSSKKKKKDLQEQLDNLQQELGDKSAEAERLRSAFGELEPILDEGHWLASGVDDLVDYLNAMTKVWTTFGSDVGQLAADASSDQLEDPAWMKKALGLDDAINQWNAVDQAAKKFTEASLVDFPSD